MESDPNRYYESHIQGLYERIERLEASRDSEARLSYERWTAISTKLAILEERCQWNGAIAGSIVSVLISVVLDLIKK